MMLHRHFEAEQDHNLTTSKETVPEEKEEFVSNIFPPEPEEEKPVRKRKTGN